MDNQNTQDNIMNNLELFDLAKYFQENQEISFDDFTYYISNYDNLKNISDIHIRYLYNMRLVIKLALAQGMQILKDNQDHNNIRLGFQDNHMNTTFLELLDIGLVHNKKDENYIAHKNMYEILVKYFNVNIIKHSKYAVREFNHDINIKKHVLQVCIEVGLDIYQKDDDNMSILDYVVDTSLYDYLIEIYDDQIKDPGYD